MQSSMIYVIVGLMVLVVGVLVMRRGKSAEPAVQAAAQDQKTLYEKLGGASAVTAAVNIFYRKVLNDDRINHFFDGVDMHRQMVKQVEFLTLALGGPNSYSGADLRRGHAHLVGKGLNDTHFDAVLEHLGATLTELKVPAQLIAQAAAIVESARQEVLGK